MTVTHTPLPNKPKSGMSGPNLGGLSGGGLNNQLKKMKNKGKKKIKVDKSEKNDKIVNDRDPVPQKGNKRNSNEIDQSPRGPSPSLPAVSNKRPKVNSNSIPQVEYCYYSLLAFCY